LERILSYFPNPLIIPVGVVIGILVAAPVGPVNIMCIQRALERGFWGGVAAGLGAVLGDGLIALFASLGMGAILGFVTENRFLIQVIGGAALLAFAVKLYITAPVYNLPPEGAEDTATLMDFIWDVPQTFFFTITNPGAVLGMFGLFGLGSTFVEVASYIDCFTMVAAIMGGSLAWWMFLSNLIGRHRHRLVGIGLQRINQISGLLLGAFGVVLIAEMALKYAWA
jgi:threonine/homoserine/homoserine lactone efflux protein